MTIRKLTEREVSTLEHGLRIAALRFQQNAMDLSASASWQALGDTYAAQANESLALADVIAARGLNAFVLEG